MSPIIKQVILFILQQKLTKDLSNDCAQETKPVVISGLWLSSIGINVSKDRLQEKNLVIKRQSYHM